MEEVTIHNKRKKVEGGIQYKAFHTTGKKSRKVVEEEFKKEIITERRVPRQLATNSRSTEAAIIAALPHGLNVSLGGGGEEDTEQEEEGEGEEEEGEDALYAGDSLNIEPELNTLPGGKRGRQENSLGELTRKFVKLIQESTTKCIDLNDTVKKLDVQKRRIYDITNVLEGIGLIEKCYKNKIRWKGTLNLTEPTQHEEELLLKKRKLDDLLEQEKDLDFWIKKMQEELNKMASTQQYNQYAYLTYEDIKQLNTSQENKRDTLLAIRAPAGTTLDVPDPAEVEDFYRQLKQMGSTNKKEPELENLLKEHKDLMDKKYQIYLNSKEEEIMVYMVSNEKGIGEGDVNSESMEDLPYADLPYASLTGMFSDKPIPRDVDAEGEKEETTNHQGDVNNPAWIPIDNHQGGDPQGDSQHTPQIHGGPHPQ